MKKPPFDWSPEDRARLRPGRFVVHYSDCGEYADLFRIVKVHGNHAFYRAGDDSFPGVLLRNLDPTSITTSEEIEDAECGLEPEEPDERSVH